MAACGVSGVGVGSLFFPGVLEHLVGFDVLILKGRTLSVVKGVALKLMATPQQRLVVQAQLLGEMEGRDDPLGEAPQNQEDAGAPAATPRAEGAGEEVEDPTTKTAPPVHHRRTPLASVRELARSQKAPAGTGQLIGVMEPH